MLLVRWQLVRGADAQELLAHCGVVPGAVGVAHRHGRYLATVNRLAETLIG